MLVQANNHAKCRAMFSFDQNKLFKKQMCGVIQIQDVGYSKREKICVPTAGTHRRECVRISEVYLPSCIWTFISVPNTVNYIHFADRECNYTYYFIRTIYVLNLFLGNFWKFCVKFL